MAAIVFVIRSANVYKLSFTDIALIQPHPLIIYKSYYFTCHCVYFTCAHVIVVLYLTTDWDPHVLSTYTTAAGTLPGYQVQGEG